ncbi:hypothetical protein BCL76_101671 [Streptomyces sp. CG 926]|uniref:hypothetical protein n=1 Tax=Streptomyces sp. CG 926 TaxID=1882405 RepID=UPI000D6AC086|nr:hypothetical protein [Streptomyces sp. CG 926]PWK74936.1 hypothetical protein BCL76_101671 [Streptomyces sp. CG 926]
MAGTDFGHAIGLPRALSGLPLSPLVGGYGELLAAQQTIGLRHLGELLIPSGGRLRVLDGIFAVTGPGRRRHVGAEVLRSLRRDRPEPAAAWLLERLAAIQDADPAALRRILLYQLTHLLQDHAQGQLPTTATGFGVDPAEAPALVRAAARRARLDTGQRAAAEALPDDVPAHRIRCAARRAQLLPPAGEDRPLAALLAEVAARAAAADTALTVARRAEEQGDPARACLHYEEAAALAGDCPRAVRGLVRTYRPDPGDPGPPRSTLVAGGVELRWPSADFGDTRWRVVRLTRGEPAGAPLAEVPGQPVGGVLLDHGAGIGEEIRHVALPLRADGTVDGPPLIAAPLSVAPAVTGAAATDGNGWLGLSWTAPADALRCEVTLTGPRGPVPVPAVVRAGPRESLRVDTKVPGRYAWVVRARYAPKGRAERGVLSAAVTVPVTVHAWPEPVLGLTALTREAGGVEFRRTGGEGAEVRLVRWPGTAPAERAELTAAELPPPLDWVAPGWTGPTATGPDRTGPGANGPDTGVPDSNRPDTSRPDASRPAATGPVCVGHPPPGSLTTVSAVSVLGARALAGPSVLVEAPLPVTGLTLRRAAPELVEVGFDWPGTAGTVTAVLIQDGRRTEFAVARSVFLREGLRLPVTPAALSVEAHTAPRGARSVLASPGGDARAELPADVAIAYELVPGARRGLRRGPAVLRVTVRAPGGAPALELPGFVLVARGDDGRDPRRPSGPTGGTAVCRVTGAELATAAAGTGTGTGTVERPIDTAVAPGRPYALRGFLLGGAAASVRLEEPPLPSLVIR